MGAILINIGDTALFISEQLQLNYLLLLFNDKCDGTQ